MQESSIHHRVVRAVQARGARFWAAVVLVAVSTLVLSALAFAVLGPSVTGVAVLLVTIGFSALLLVASGQVLRLARAVIELEERQQKAAVDDDLTGVSNRRHFLQTVDREFARCRRYGEEGALLLIDADHLRRINEHLGQSCGDALLMEVTRRVGLTLRQPDLLARFGGAELAVFLPKTDPLGALDAAERIRQQVASTPYQWQQTHVIATVSIGVSTVHPGQLSVDTMVHEAEQALEAAKEAGRNCVRTGPIKPQRSGESRSVTPS
jgi:diguanylate cyclase (GGDEF)-like protein